MNHGFVKVAAAIPSVRVADPQYNVEQIESLVIQAEGKGIEIICLPELSLTSYSCGDLFGQQLLLDEAEMALIHLMNTTRSLNIISIVGLPVPYRGALLNTGDGSLSYNGEKIELTKNEYRILLGLMQSKGKTVSREKLMELLWESDEFVDDNTLTVNIGRLRKKLDAAGLHDFITTKHGVGYLIQ